MTTDFAIDFIDDNNQLPAHTVPNPANGYQPFPVELLPEPVQSYVRSSADDLGCDAAYLALPLLTALAAAIGNTRRLQLNATWLVPPILWTAIIGASGQGKSPAFRRTLQFVEHHEAEAYKAFQADYAAYQDELDDAKLGGMDRDGDPDELPTKPVRQRFRTNDTTLEAFVSLLANNSRGLLLANDELSGWLGSFDQYRAGVGGDAARWLSMYGAESLQVDRKTGPERELRIAQAAVCITGGIQPAIFRQMMGRQHRDSGMLARFLLACPPSKPKRFRRETNSQAVDTAIAGVFKRLYGIPLMLDELSVPVPVIVQLSEDALDCFEAFYNEHNQQAAKLDDDLRAAWSKLEEVPARLALVLQMIRWAADDHSLSDSSVVDAATMQNAISLTEWFKQETRRVYHAMAAIDGKSRQGKLLAFVGRFPNGVTVRDVQQGCSWLASSAEIARRELEQLVESGHLRKVRIPSGERGGHPTVRYMLNSLSGDDGSVLPNHPR